jgi:histidinol-phosphate/aromatic aminotransferase/cobyric acid decarboxylase-like protein
MSYTATMTKDLSATTPTEGSTLPSELNDAIREIKSCMLYEKGLLAKTADYSMDAKDNIVICTPSSVDIIVTLPQASACSTSAYSKIVIIRNYETYDVVVDGYGAETIDSAATLTLRPNLAAILVCNGTMWYSIRTQPKFRGARITNVADCHRSFRDRVNMGYRNLRYRFDT